jgi:hypothetical protein
MFEKVLRKTVGTVLDNEMKMKKKSDFIWLNHSHLNLFLHTRRIVINLELDLLTHLRTHGIVYSL